MAGHLRVKVLQGRQLLAMDTTGTSDPYVVVQFNSEVTKTPVIKRTLEPKWEHDNEFKFLHRQPTSTITFQVFDWDAVGENDFLGMATLTVGKGHYSCDTCWIDLQPRPGELDDQKLWEKHGTFGQIKVAYWHTYYELSKYIASDSFLEQLQLKDSSKASGDAPDGKLLQTKRSQTKVTEYDPKTIQSNIARLSQHAFNFSKPVRWVRDHLLGYRMVVHDRTLEVETVDEGRGWFFLLVTAILLIGYLPLPAVERVSRATIPLTLLCALLASKRAHAGPSAATDPAENPFLFLRSPVCLRAWFGDDAAVFNSSKWLPFSVFTWGSEKKEIPEELLLKSLDKALKYLGFVADKAEMVHEVITWERQREAEEILKGALLVALALFFLPTPPLGPTVWCIFTYIFFVPRLRYTSPNIYSVVNINFLLNSITFLVENILVEIIMRCAPLHRLFQKYGFFEELDPVRHPSILRKSASSAIASSVLHSSKVSSSPSVKTAESSSTPPTRYTTGMVVEVQYEEEDESGKWSLVTSKGTVEKVLPDSKLSISWGDGSPTFVCDTSNVVKVVEEHSAQSNGTMTNGVHGHRVGDLVEVRYEVEVHPDTWETTSGVGRITRLDSSAKEAEIDWGDDAPRYKCSIDDLGPPLSASSVAS